METCKFPWTKQGLWLLDTIEKQIYAYGGIEKLADEIEAESIKTNPVFIKRKRPAIPAIKNRYTKEQEDFIHENYLSMPIETIASIIGRSVKIVKRKGQELRQKRIHDEFL